MQISCTPTVSTPWRPCQQQQRILIFVSDLIVNKTLSYKALYFLFFLSNFKWGRGIPGEGTGNMHIHCFGLGMNIDDVSTSFLVVISMSRDLASMTAWYSLRDSPSDATNNVLGELLQPHRIVLKTKQNIRLEIPQQNCKFRNFR